MKASHSIPSALLLYPRPPTLLCGRADNACTNLLGSFVRYVRTRGIAETVESGKTADFRSVLCRTHLPRMACATNSCTRKVFFKREESPLKWLLVLFFTEKYDKGKVALWFYRVVEGADPYKLKPKYSQQSKQEIKSFIRFFFCIYRRKRKSYQKENAERGLTHMRSMCVGVAETG